MKLGSRIRRLLAEREMTQRELARLVGVSEPTMSQYIKGDREPDLTTLDKLATVLNCTLDYLLGRTADPKGVTPRHIPDDWEQIIDNLIHEGISPEDIAQAKELIKAYKKMQTREG